MRFDRELTAVHRCWTNEVRLLLPSSHFSGLYMQLSDILQMDCTRDPCNVAVKRCDAASVGRHGLRYQVHH